MSADIAPTSWLEANQRYCMAALDVVRAMLEEHAERTRGGSTHAGDRSEATRTALAAAQSALPAPAALQTIAAAFGLSAFERDLLMLCAGVELDASFAALCGPAPTFGLALAIHPDAHWSALAPAAPLRAWRLLELDPRASPTRGALRIDERILHAIAGVSFLDERLRGIVEPIGEAGELSPSQIATAETIVTAWCAAQDTARRQRPPVVHIEGEPGAARAIAAHACRLAGLDPYSTALDRFPTDSSERESSLVLWEREALVDGRALVLVSDESPDPASERFLADIVARTRGAIFVIERVRRHRIERASFPVVARLPAKAEQHVGWQRALGPHVAADVTELSDEFDFSLETIRDVAARATSGLATGDARAVLWDAARDRARPRLERLAARIDARADWDSLVLAEPERTQLREIALHVRKRAHVHDEWGFAEHSSRGLGLTVLFSGRPGTGKTMAAEAIARELRLDLYRIDLSVVTSKYLGETEKQIGRIFDATDRGGAMLLFDEAEALFTKRTEVRDSHDRYANLETSYLLQRIEGFRGLAILTTNNRHAIDPAFFRRIAFVVNFPIPSAIERAELWRRVFPARTPLGDLDYERLARLNVAGGNIRNIALHAAFLAADVDVPISMAHLARAARSECRKIEKILGDEELQGWEAGDDDASRT